MKKPRMYIRGSADSARFVWNISREARLVSHKNLLMAQWIAPMDAPLLRDAAIVFEANRIVDLGASGKLRQRHPEAAVHELGDSIILPGLVNAHAHLELSGCTAGDAPASFTDWIASMPGRIGPERDFAAAALAGSRQSVGFGVTRIGDISQQCQSTRSALRNGLARAVSFGEVLGIGGTRWKVDPLLERAVDSALESPLLRIGVSPHAPYSLDRSSYERVVQSARQMRLPVATHLAEVPFEREFLQGHSGPFRELLERIGIWQDDIQTFPGGPIEFAQSIGLLDSPALLAHVNYCDDGEMDLLANGRASVVYCPRTHAYFGHSPHRWREMLQRGINVAAGTDSCASSPDLNLVDDIRLLHKIAPEIPSEMMWQMITQNGARAIQAEKQAGSLTVGKDADIAVFPTGGPDPLTEILESPILPKHVWIAGKPVLG